MRAIVARLAQIALGLVLGLVVIEGVLQCGALITSLRGGSQPARVAEGRRVVFLGDSNTAGFGAGPGNAYPLVLDRLWNSAPGGRRVEVFNLGMIGVNSSRLRQQFREILATLRPDIVTIMIGANDLWTVPVPLSEEESTWHYRLWGASRAYRFLYMLGKLWQNENAKIAYKRPEKGPPVMTVGEHITLGWTSRGDGAPEWSKALQQNLEAMIADGREAGVEIILLTYPSEGGLYAPANGVIRDTAAATQSRLIDLGAAFLRTCPSRECPDLFLADGHPTKAGHQLAATLLAQELSPVAEP
jgi:lysophospholipase L1-like esterase